MPYDRQNCTLKYIWRKEPRCYAPQVDVTHASQAYGNWALPKLARELCGPDRNIVRQAVTTIADIAVNPEEMTRIVELRIPERIADFLVSEDHYLRERVAMIYGTMSRRAAGIDAILRCPKILAHLIPGMVDDSSIVRTKVARVIVSLARNPIAGQVLYERGILEKLLKVIDSENNSIILALHLESLGSLLNNNETPGVNTRAIEIKVMEKLAELLNIRNNNDEKVVVETLKCLARLCQEPPAKQKSIEMDLLLILKKFLNDERASVYTAAASVIVFSTITTQGKFRALELGVVDRLVKLATSTADTHDKQPDARLFAIQALTNIAQAPDGRRTLISSIFIADIETCAGDDATDKYKNILMEIINSPAS